MKLNRKLRKALDAVSTISLLLTGLMILFLGLNTPLLICALLFSLSLAAETPAILAPRGTTYRNYFFRMVSWMTTFALAYMAFTGWGEFSLWRTLTFGLIALDILLGIIALITTVDWDKMLTDAQNAFKDEDGDGFDDSLDPDSVPPGTTSVVRPVRTK